MSLQNLAPQELIQALRNKGVIFSFANSELVVKAPPGVLNQDLLSYLKSIKPHIEAALKQEAANTIPLLSSQKGLLFLQKLHPRSSSYHIAASFNVTETIDKSVLEKALTTLMARHELLRAQINEQNTAFNIDSGILPQVDYIHLNEAGQLKSLLESEFSKPFDLAKGPLFRLALVTERSRQTVQIVFHHLIADAISCQVFAREILEVYTQLKLATPPSLTGAPSFKDYQRKQARYFDSAGLQEDRSYWQKRLQTAALNNKSFGVHDRPHAKTLRQSLSLDTIRRLRSDLATQRLTEFQFFISLFHWLAGLWTNQQELLVGYPVSGRESSQENGLIGSLINSLPFFASFENKTNLKDHLQKCRDLLISDLKHQKFPLEEIAKSFSQQSLMQNPSFFEFFFVMQGDFQTWQNLSGIEILHIDGKEAKFPFTLSVVPKKETYDITIEYAENLYPESHVQEFLKTYLHLVMESLNSWNKNLEDIPLQARDLTESLVHSQWPAKSSGAVNVYSSFLQRAAENPKAMALVWSQGSFTYGELTIQVRKCAAKLSHVGVTKGSLVALATSSETNMVIAILALYHLRAAYLPLDPLSPTSRLEMILEDGRPDFLIKDQSYAALHGNCSEVFIEEILEDSSSTTHLKDITPQAADAADLAYVIFTSGSTGRPKGVPISQENLGRLFLNTQEFFSFEKNDRWALFHSVAFDYSVWEIWGALTSGACLYIPERKVKMNSPLFAQWLVKNEITVLNQTPSSFYQVAKPLWAAKNYGHLRWILLSGEAVDIQLLQPWFHTFADHGPRIINSYGITETTVLVALKEIHSSDLLKPEKSPLGTPMGDLKIALVNSQMQPVPLGFPGEIVVAGPGVSKGYWLNPDLSENKFIQHSQLGMLYRSGDLARQIDPVNIEYMGRIDHQVKLRGFRIELAEIESAIRRTNLVQDAIVELREINKNPFLVAFILGQKNSFDSQELKNKLMSLLPAALVPAHYVQVEKWPLNINGKIDRKQLLWSPTESAPFATKTENSYVTKIIVDILEELLGQKVDTQKPFFEMGAHSLLLVTAHQKLQEKLKIDIPLTTFFEYPSIDKLAAHLSPAEPEHSVPSASPRLGTSEPIAVIGIGCRLPDAKNWSEFWEQLVSGKESIREIENWNSSTNSKQIPWTSYLEDIDLFDADFFKIPPREAELMDPQQRVLLELAHQTLEEAGYASNTEARKVGTFVSSTLSRYLLFHILPQKEKFADIHPLQIISTNDKDYLASKLAFKLNLSGPAMSIQTACSSSLVALHQAVQSLRNGDCEMALAGGISLLLDKEAYLYEEGGIGSKDGRCRPFDESASGTVAGSGAGLVLLKPLSQALKDQDRIFSVIKGSAINNDGKDKVGFAAPSINGQMQVLKSALQDSSLQAHDIEFIETHGTATRLGDQIELEALSRVYKNPSEKIQLGAVKANLGHLDAAAGIIGFIKASLSVYHGNIPPQLHFKKFPLELEKFSSSFDINTNLKSYLKPMRRAAVSSFGIGGTNAHVILESAPTSTRRSLITTSTHFARKRYWIDKPLLKTQVLDEKKLQGFEPIWEQVPLKKLNKVEDSPCLVIGDSPKNFQQLFLNAFTEAKIPYTFVSASSIQQQAPHCDLSTFKTIFYLDTIVEYDKTVSEDKIFTQPLAWLRYIAKNNSQATTIFIRNYSEKFQDSEPILPELHKLQGLFKTLPLEIPGLKISSLDIKFEEWDALSTLKSCQHLQESENSSLVLRHTLLWKRSWKSVSWHQEQALTNCKTIWITGARGGIGRELTQYLLEKTSANLVLFTSGDHSTEPSHPRLHWVQCNFKNSNHLKPILQDLILKSFDPDVVFHLANEDHFSLLIDEKKSFSSETMLAKTLPPEIIKDALAEISDQKKRQLILFSSLNSELGAVGHFHYNGANRFLDAFAEAHESDNLQIKSVLWGAWKNTGLRKKMKTLLNDASDVDIEFSPDEALAQIPGILGSSFKKRILAKQALQDLELLQQNLPRNTVKPKNLPDRQTLLMEISTIWQERLGVKSIPQDASFFDLGGDSLLALEIKEEIEKKYLITINLEDLLKSQTLRQLVDLLKPEPVNTKSSSNILVPLSKVPASSLYCVHAVMGTVFPFLELAKRLEPEFKLIALQAPGLTGDSPAQSLEELASLYLEEIKLKDGAYPEHLSGWSFGALVAFEMARQLEQKGQALKSLSLLDMTITSSAHQDFELNETALRDKFLEDLKAIFKKDLSENSEEVRQLFTVFKNHVQLTRDYYSHCHDYAVTPLKTAATLYRAQDGMGKQHPHHDLGWSNYFKNLEIKTVFGDHYTMLNAPYVNELGQEIKREIQ